jgi:hypothetical protein
VFSQPNPGGGSAQPPLIQQSPIQKLLARGAPLYVRVVPIGANGLYLCDPSQHGASAIAIVSYYPVDLDNTLYPPAKLSGSYQPAQPVTPYDACVVAVKAFTFNRDYVESHPLELDRNFRPSNGYALTFIQAGAYDYNPNNHPDDSIIHPGKWVCWNPSSPNAIEQLIDDFGNFISGVVDGIAALVNYIAKLYDDIKNDIVNLVADAIRALQIPCDGPCHEALNIALTTALASMGLPPELPNFDELANQGFDYLTKAIADETGVPPEVVSRVADVTRTVLSEAASSRGGGGGLPDWLSYDNRFRPSIVTLQLTMPSRGPLPLFLNADFPSGLYSYNSAGYIRIPLPTKSLNYGETITIPIQLPPDLSGIDGPSPDPLFQWPPEYILKVKLKGWYEKKFSSTPCSTFGFNFASLSGGTSLGKHTLTTLSPATFGPGDSNTCQ